MTVTPPAPPPEKDEVYSLRAGLYERAGGVLVPLAATVLAFLIGGLVVLITGHNPVTAYKAIFEGAGFNWFLPWETGDARDAAARDLQQTLRAGHAAHPRRARGRLRLPLRPVQHRRAGPVLGRVHRSALRRDAPARR